MKVIGYCHACHCFRQHGCVVCSATEWQAKLLKAEAKALELELVLAAVVPHLPVGIAVELQKILVRQRAERHAAAVRP